MSFRSLASLRVAAFLAALLVVSACSDNRSAQLSAIETIDIPAADPGAQANQNIDNPTLVIPDTFPIAEGDELRLVFEEEFNGPDINTEVWFFATGDGTEKGLPGGWGNNELQYYLPDNAQIVNGVLEITARRETVGDLNYTSARINTEDRFAFKYGRIEASIKMPSGQGLWPAFWMLSQDSDYVCGVDNQGNDRPCIWAAVGEIDIVEAVNLDGTNGNEIFATIHYGGEFPANQSTSVTYTPSVDVTENFNTYAIEWGADEIRWYFNGELYASQPSDVWSSAADNAGPSAPFDQNFHVLLNLAVGGNFPGDPNGTTPFPATMEVDWVRVYSGEDPDGGVATEPNAAAPTPTEDPADVTSLFSDAYDDIAGIDYNPDWGQATEFTLAQIAGNEMLKYANLDFQGIDFAGNPQDVSGKGFLHVDVWTADSTALNAYLISPGPVETSYELTGDIAPNSWVSVDIPLSEFAGVDLTNLIQLKFDGNGTIFLDNLYFAGEAPIIVPPVGVAPPTQDEGAVISLFSGDYTNQTVTWPTPWSVADAGVVSDVTIGGTLVREHLGINFVGVEFVVDASAMTHLHLDVWTPDADSLLLRLVDFLGDGFDGPAGNTEAELTFDLTSSQGEWVSLDIPLSDFQDAGLLSVSDLNQLVIDPTPDGTALYVANVYFYNEGGVSTDPVVFADDYGTGVSFAPFGGSVNNLTVDTTEVYSGAASL
ncbi:MAG: glycoside hydrolase family 16 protein, partial [Woeseiaceae bacterium]|nr:glycoside hydrolase family 16 protein [Woeseiaceae bacterium]